MAAQKQVVLEATSNEHRQSLKKPIVLLRCEFGSASVMILKGSMKSVTMAELKAKETNQSSLRKCKTGLCTVMLISLVMVCVGCQQQTA